jgi:hypothetical protein
VQEDRHRAWISRRRSLVVAGLSMPPREPAAGLGLTTLGGGREVLAGVSGVRELAECWTAWLFRLEM